MVYHCLLLAMIYRRMMNTFIVVNTTPICNSLEDKSMFQFKKEFPLTSLGHSFERRSYCYCFVLKVARYSLFLHRQSGQRMLNTLLMIILNPTCKRLLILIYVTKKTETWFLSPISK